MFVHLILTSHLNAHTHTHAHAYKHVHITRIIIFDNIKEVPQKKLHNNNSNTNNKYKKKEKANNKLTTPWCSKKIKRIVFGFNFMSVYYWWLLWWAAFYKTIINDHYEIKWPPNTFVFFCSCFSYYWHFSDNDALHSCDASLITVSCFSFPTVAVWSCSFF